MSTGIVNQRDIETRIEALRKQIDIHLSVGDADGVNKMLDEISALYKLLMNQTVLMSKNERDGKVND